MYYTGPPTLIGTVVFSAMVALGLYASYRADLPWWIPVIMVACFVGYVALYLHQRRTKRANGD